ncbi:putative RNA methyltransferase [Intestinimonas massiliensis (ex Afouda et al. 2020)]|uniref:putative RNA methyltransferase n=1 Tax=Intestinimonas massiliensis (ex Afouda et al. 2020) TaxID=1673721 RepID=UPI00102F78ED|nr:methyltransferase domain-containing protein [Intestinimonas massiliensis (ex Afouda et al. 2020)]
MNDSLLCCPICGGKLSREEGRYICPGGHSYDRAREGYVHLLPANRKHAREPGDDKGMTAARNRFLSKDYYAPLRETLCTLALERVGREGTVLDSGCGEGYYTQGVWQALTGAGKAVRLAGIDLSKPSVRLAARRLPEGEFAVASAYHLPVGAETIDLLLNCFSPLALEEFRRVLRPGGAFLYVVPGADHLWELKQVLYDTPYRNKEEDIPYEGFSYERVVPVKYKMAVAGEDLKDLFQMTPYYWKTPKEGAARLAALDGLEITADFRIHVFRRSPPLAQ